MPRLLISNFPMKGQGGKSDIKMEILCCGWSRWNKMERWIKCLGKIFITSSNYKLKLGNESFMGAEGIL